MVAFVIGYLYVAVAEYVSYRTHFSALETRKRSALKALIWPWFAGISIYNYILNR